MAKLPTSPEFRCYPSPPTTSLRLALAKVAMTNWFSIDIIGYVYIFFFTPAGYNSAHVARVSGVIQYAPDSLLFRVTRRNGVKLKIRLRATRAKHFTRPR